jgi:tubulin gamma
MLVSTAQDPDLIIMLCVLQDNDLSEFDESREIVQNLVDEYKACESADYIKWGMEDRGKAMTSEGNVSGTLDSRVPAL